MSKITIEDVIKKRFTGEIQTNFLDFATHLRTLNLPLREFDTEEKTYFFDIDYKGVTLCFIHVGPKSVRIYSSQVPCSWIYWNENGTEYPEPIVDGTIKKIAWKKVRKCNSCGCPSAPGKRKRILGKEFDNVCVSALGFSTPKTADLECVKQMITAMKHDVDAM
ncbi:MAG: hypothetical protein FWC32_06275 [Firmicutes bacterium]|nr:hypothetical protein [Bacillota bacterium]